MLQVGTASDTYLPLNAIGDGATSVVQINQTVKLTVIGRNFATLNARCDLLWTAPYTVSSVPAFTRAANGLTAFPGSAATSSHIIGARIQRNIAAANSFTVDPFSLDDAASTAITATYKLIPPQPGKVVNISGIYPQVK